MKKFLVIGLGRFGKSVLRELHNLGYDVVGCDQDEHALNEAEQYADYLVSGDATEDSVLEEINVEDFDTVVVSMGDNFEAAVLIVTKLKNMGCKNIISKANDHLRGQVISAVGANQVIFPEEETGMRLARRIVTPGVLEHIELGPHCSGVEMKVPDEFVGKSMSQIDLRKKYKVTLVLINREGFEFPLISPSADEVLLEKDVIFVVGEDKNLDRLRRKLE